jgi:hypothetical protein
MLTLCCGSIYDVSCFRVAFEILEQFKTLFFIASFSEKYIL